MNITNRIWCVYFKHSVHKKKTVKKTNCILCPYTLGL